MLNGRFVIRLAIGNVATEWQDLEEVWELVKQTAGSGVVKE